MRFNLGPFDAEIHRLARIRSAEKNLKIKQYIAELIIEDVQREAQAARRSASRSPSGASPRVGIKTNETTS